MLKLPITFFWLDAGFANQVSRGICKLMAVTSELGQMTRLVTWASGDGISGKSLCKNLSAALLAMSLSVRIDSMHFDWVTL